MRRRVVILPALAVLALAGCQTGGSHSAVNPKAATSGSPSERLVKLADDIAKRGDSDTAIALYQKAAALPDARPSAYVKTGDAYMRAGDPALAAKAYQAALAKAPDNGEAMLGLGSAMMDAGDYNAGMRALAQAAPLVNTSSSYNRLGVAQTLSGHTQEAQNTFGQALKMAPGDLDIETNMALAAGLEGNAGVALPLAQKLAGASNAQLHHKRNAVIVFGLLGQGDQLRAAPPVGLPTQEINKLLSQAQSIRAKGSTQARAQALGSILG